MISPLEGFEELTKKKNSLYHSVQSQPLCIVVAWPFEGFRTQKMRIWKTENQVIAICDGKVISLTRYGTYIIYTRQFFDDADVYIYWFLVWLRCIHRERINNSSVGNQYLIFGAKELKARDNTIDSHLTRYQKRIKHFGHSHTHRGDTF